MWYDKRNEDEDNSNLTILSNRIDRFKRLGKDEDNSNLTILSNRVMKKCNIYLMKIIQI